MYGRWIVPLAMAGSLGCLDVTHVDTADPAALRRVLETPGPTAPFDVAIALGCPADEDTGRVSPCQRCRIDSVVGAYQAGEVRAVIMSGSAAHNRSVEADVMADAAIARGVPRAAIEREPRALTTWMNLRYSQRIMRARGWKTALIISTADHLPRAKRFADWYGIDARYRACDR